MALLTLPYKGDYKVTQGFGGNGSYYQQNGINIIGHNGWDIALPRNTPVYAGHDGTAWVGSETNGYGKFVFINGSELSTVHGHLLSQSVRTGQFVRQGQEIARSDSTGFSTGDHLHWGVRPAKYDPNNGYLGYVDPNNYLKGDDFMKPTRDHIMFLWTACLNRNPTEQEIALYTSLEFGRVLQALNASPEFAAVRKLVVDGKAHERIESKVDKLLENG